MVEMAPRRSAGIGNVVWSLNRFFAFLNAAGLSDVRVDGLLAHAAPRRVRALPCFTREETSRLLEGIETGTPCGKRDYAMVMLAVSTGLRCCNIVALRLDEIDWHRDEIRLVQAKTSRPLVLPLPAPAGNAVAEWILHGQARLRRPGSIRPAQGAAGETGELDRLDPHAPPPGRGIDHAARDGKSFHALRRTTGTRLIESGAGLPLAAQILGHARINSSRRYFALASEQLRQCCLPLEEFTCTREGLR